MVARAFEYEDDPLKHYVRVKGWLPLCVARQKHIKRRDRRDLRYFTFCGMNAVDVFMLDLAGVIRRSRTGRFDSVCFFDRTEEVVASTLLRIPGANGFHGDFVKTVLGPPLLTTLTRLSRRGTNPVLTL
jgi:hypothetical protein